MKSSRSCLGAPGRIDARVRRGRLWALAAGAVLTAAAFVAPPQFQQFQSEWRGPWGAIAAWKLAPAPAFVPHDDGELTVAMCRPTDGACGRGADRPRRVA